MYKMKNKGLFLRISILLVGILFFYKNGTAQCSNFNLTVTQSNDGPFKNDVTLNASTVGATSNVIYHWYNMSNGMMSYVGNENLVSGFGAGTYSVSAYDSLSGCSDTFDFTAVDTGSFNCNNLYVYKYKSSDSCQVLNDTKYTVDAYNGSGNYSYTWSHTSQNASTVSFPSNGKYYVTISDITNNCTRVDSVNVIDCNPAYCSGLATTISKESDGPSKNDVVLKATTLGGSGQYNYQWKKNNIVGYWSPIYNQSAGQYTVFISDSLSGCKDTAYYSATDTGSFSCNSLSIAKYKHDSCSLTNDVSYSINVYGGSGNYSYAWSHSSQNVSNISFPSNGKYFVTITDLTNNCSKTDSVDVIDCNSTNCQGLMVNLSKLSDGNSTNDVQIKAVASGGSGVYTYTWNNFQYWGGTISNKTSGMYIVRVFDSISSCVLYDSIYVTDTSYNPCANTFTATFTKLADGPSVNDVSVKVVFSGGTAPYTYYWNKGNNSYMNTTVTNVGAGIIEFYIYDTLGCSKTFQYNVVDTFDSTNICNGFEGFVYKDDSCGLNDVYLFTNVMNGSGNYSYKWNNGDTINYLFSKTTGSYSVIITDIAKGCIDTVSISVVDTTCIVDPCANFSTYIYNYDSCGNNDIKLVAYYWGSNSNSVKFEWSTGSKASELYNLPSGTYWVAALDSINNCRDTAYITAIDSNKKCCHAGFYTNDYFVNASKTLYNYSSSNYSSLKSQLWSFGDGATATTYNANHTYTNAGNYTVCLYIEDSIGCKDTFCDILTAPAPGKNLKVTHYQGWPNNNYVPGQPKDVFVMYENIGTTTENVFVEYYFPTGMTFVNSNPVPFGVLPDRLIFKKDNFQPGMTDYINITMISPSTFTFGQYKCDETKILSMTNDIDVSNNVSTLCDSVRSSYDPNDKNSYPSGIGEEGIIDPNTKELSYLIRFQNEGNWRTYTVRVEDEIDPSFDINSLKLGDVSHDFRLVKKGRKLIWYFDNIHLTPKSEDEAKSSGFISYTMKLNAGLPLGTKIKNTAYIYFDYNEAIITNTKVNTLKSTSSLQSAANNDENNFNVSRLNANEIQIKALANIQNISIYNIQGVKLLEQNANQKSIIIDDASLSQGIYIINVQIGENTISKKVRL